MFFAFSPAVFWPYFGGVAIVLLGLFATRHDIAQAQGLDKVVAFGRVCFAAPLAVFGAEHLTSTKDIMQLVPAYMPGRLFWTYFVGVALIAAALSIALNIRMRWSGTLLGIMFILFVLMMDIPGVAGNPKDRFGWTLALRELSFASGAWALAGSQTEDWRSGGTSWMITVARYVIAIAAIFYGLEHLLHPAALPGVPLEKLTPAWIPGRLIAGYLTGAALATAGVCLLIGMKMRMAAACLGTWILIIVLLMYLPMVIAIPSAAEAGVKIEGLNYFFDTLLFGGTVLALANALPKARP